MKPLLFTHGREAYRRNSLLVLYTFYKNVLYVTTQFWHGWLGAFSGQTLYEPFIYQLYNITMTSMPVMWYAVFDFEHKRDLVKDQNYISLNCCQCLDKCLGFDDQEFKKVKEKGLTF